MAGCVRGDQASPAPVPAVPKRRFIYYDNRADGGDALSFGLFDGPGHQRPPDNKEAWLDV